VSVATKDVQRQLHEFARLLSRNQASYKNFSIFDSLKAEPERCEMLLKVLPCWIMTPDDVARLFPCTPGLFDIVIIDEASQCDLPSMTPILYRANQAIIAGDSFQMQAQRFRFTSDQVAVQAWHEQGMDRFDPNRLLDPSRVDLLQLGGDRRDEEAFLDEHYRSLGPIISFSNHRWYRDRLRIMRDLEDRRVGDPNDPIVRLHEVENALVTPGTQENEAEALAAVQFLEKLLHDPTYAGASVGVICLFEEQMRLVAELVAERIDEETRSNHSLVVVNPDGFQGDERDVVVYSLSYDARNMTQAQLSARQADVEHIQGMLNVGFTRARDQMHIFISAPIDTFGMASGRGAIKEWLEHCVAAQAAHRDRPVGTGVNADSEFEAEVARALRARGLRVLPQYPSCGFRLDVMVERAGARVAVECDGEVWHLDENGELRTEDLQRQEILERAGWRVIRIPYRQWRKDPEHQIAKVIRALDELDLVEGDTSGLPEASDHNSERLQLANHEAAILTALNEGLHEHEKVLRRAREVAGHGRLGSNIRVSLEEATAKLVGKGLVVIEDGEIFATERGRTAIVEVLYPMVSPRDRSRRHAGRRRASRRRGYYQRRW
jgi:very-short-patch-repair endonuclease